MSNREQGVFFRVVQGSSVLQTVAPIASSAFNLSRRIPLHERLRSALLDIRYSEDIRLGTPPHQPLGEFVCRPRIYLRPLSELPFS
jgi:hypothetical protein